VLTSAAQSESFSARPWAALRWSRVLLALLLLHGAVCAQPYAAGGGFGRPWHVGASASSMRFAASGGEDGPVVFWSDANGILSSNLRGSSKPERLFEGRGIRELTASEVSGSAALAWARRDLGTGRTEHRLRWRGEEKLLLDALQPYDMSIVAAPSGPAVLMSRGESGVSVLRLIEWDGNERVLHRSELSLVRYEALFDDEGALHVVWLEGFSDRTAVGIAAAEWNAYLARFGPDGERSLRKLGRASYQGVASQTELVLEAGRPAVLWSGPDGQVMYSRTVDEAVDEAVTVGRGSPVGMADGLVYWADGTSLRARDPLAPSEPVNVGWSPVTIQRGELLESGGYNYLAWYGPARGGDYAVMAAADRQPLQPTLLDRVAAQMGWSPWGFWQALLGQALGSLFTGVVVSMALSPLLWLLAALMVRAGWASRPHLAGIALGALAVVALLAIVAARSRLPPETHQALFGSLPELLLALLLPAGATWLLRRRADSEQLIGILGGAWLYLFLSTSLLAFLTFQAWLEYWTAIA
jgi:hypothetical protein